LISEKEKGERKQRNKETIIKTDKNTEHTQTNNIIRGEESSICYKQQPHKWWFNTPSAW